MVKQRQKVQIKIRTYPLLILFLPVLFQWNTLNMEKLFLELRSCLTCEVALSPLPKLLEEVTFLTEIVASLLIIASLMTRYSKDVAGRQHRGRSGGNAGQLASQLCKPYNSMV